jgi:hypothetical protein
MSADESEVHDAISTLLHSYAIDDRYARDLPPLVISDHPFNEQRRKRRRYVPPSSPKTRTITETHACIRYRNAQQKRGRVKLARKAFELIPCTGMTYHPKRK